MKSKIKIFMICSLVFMAGNEVFGSEKTEAVKQTWGQLAKGWAGWAGYNKELISHTKGVLWPLIVTATVAATGAAAGLTGWQAYRWRIAERIKRTALKMPLHTFVSTEDFKKSIDENQTNMVNKKIKDIPEKYEKKVTLIVSNSRNTSLYAMDQLNEKLRFGTQYFITPRILYPTREEFSFYYTSEGILKAFIEWMTKSGRFVQGDYLVPQTILLPDIDAVFDYDTKKLKQFFLDFICKAPDTKKFIFSTENYDLVNLLNNTCVETIELPGAEKTSTGKISEEERLEIYNKGLNKGTEEGWKKGINEGTEIGKKYIEEHQYSGKNAPSLSEYINTQLISTKNPLQPVYRK